MQPPANNRLLTIFHTNDFHNCLTESKENNIRTLFYSAAVPKLLLDAGDAGGSGNVTFRTSGEPILERMSEIGYSAMTVGNRDFHVSRHGFRCKLFRAAFPMLCANIRPSRSRILNADNEDSSLPLHLSDASDEPPIYSYLMLQPSPNWKVLILGLTVPMVTERMWERKLSAYIFDDPIRAAGRLLPGLRERFTPDVTILLTHIGLKRDRQLAETVPGIDLIIGGHSHDVLPAGEWVGETLLAQAGSHAKYIGIVEIEPREHAGSPLRMRSRLEAL